MKPEYTRNQIFDMHKNDTLWRLPRAILVKHYWLLPLSYQNEIKYVVDVSLPRDYGVPVIDKIP